MGAMVMGYILLGNIFTSYAGFSYEMLHMYYVEKCSAVLNVTGFTRLDAYVYGPITKWQHWDMFILGKQTSRSPKRCTSQNANSAEFLETDISMRPRV